jgi:hypothetical protein
VPDPYAERAARGRDRPSGEAPWIEAVLERGGAVVEDLAGASGADAPFLAIPFAGSRVLAPIARLDPTTATLVLVLESAERPDAVTLATASAALADFEGPLYAIKHGVVAGPAGSAGCVEVDDELISAVLDAEHEGRVRWELDPDFGYEVPATVPGLTGDRADALCPRLLYAAHDRVYEHAETAARVKRERHEQLVARFGGDPPAELAAATGWPIEPTGGSWKDG